MDWNKYSSRKLLVVLLIAGLTTALAMIGKLDSNVANIFTGIVIVYPAAQGWIDAKST